MKLYQIVVLFATIVFVTARETTRAINRSDNYSASKDEFNKVAENRKHKPYHDLFLFERKSGFSTVYVNPLHGIAFMGGLQSLVTFVVIKIKIVLVAVTIIGVIALALKLFGVLKYTGYIYKNDYPPIVPSSQEFSRYPGPPSFSPHDHDGYSNDDWPTYSEHYARSSSKFPKSVNMTEIMYSFMNVDKNECQARLICEFEIMLSSSPLYNYLTSQIIARKELTGSNNHFEDCTAYYTKCLGSTAKRLTRRRKKTRDERRGDNQRIIHKW